MGKLVNGINGAFEGKVGTVIGSSWKGLYYIKARPRRRTKKRGVKEKLNQGNFATLHYWLQPIIEFLRVGFKGYAPGVEGFIAAKSWALKNAFMGVGSNRQLDPALVRVSFGDLPLPADISVTKSPDHVLTFTWNGALVNGANHYDQAMLLAYNDVNKEKIIKLTGQFRNSGGDLLALPERPGSCYHIYLAFTAHDRSRQSHSVYLGTVTT
jgi:hypothetical protein